MPAARREITWQFLLELERPTREAIPDRGHQVIAEMEGHFDAVWTLTQNVDILHRRAGSWTCTSTSTTWPVPGASTA
jgi:NAD-dependent deacetylase